MDKTEYMTALKQALEGLPSEVIEETMWSYEKKFLDAMVAGRSEAEIAAGLPVPSLVAAQKKASLKLDAVKKHASPGNIASLFVSVLGLLIFNFFMIIPAMMYVSLLVASYAVALCLYVAGVGVTAASISGVDHFNIDVPVRHHVIIDDSHVHFDRDGGDVTVDIGPAGVLVNGRDEESETHIHAGKSSLGVSVTVPSEQVSSSAVIVGPATASAVSSATSAATTAASAGVVSSAAVDKVAAKNGTTDQDKVHVRVGNQMRLPNVWRGLGLLLGGIALFLFSLFMTRFTFIGFKHYLQWNVSLLRAPLAA